MPDEITGGWRASLKESRAMPTKISGLMGAITPAKMPLDFNFKLRLAPRS